MIKRKDTLTTIPSPALLGGEGTIYRTAFLQPEEFHGKGRLFAHMRIPPGSSIGVHVHEGEQETLFNVVGRIKCRSQASGKCTIRSAVLLYFRRRWFFFNAGTANYRCNEKYRKKG